MRSILCVATTLLAAASVYAQNSFTIDTPANAVVCQPVLLNWHGGTAPYFLSVLPGATPQGQALVDLGQQNGTSFTWRVNVAAGTSIGLTLRDNNGLVAQSAAFTINPGSDTSCVGKAVSGSGGTATPTNANTNTNTGANTNTNTNANTGTGSPATTTTSGGAANTGTSTGSGSTKTSNAAVANLASVGTAGIVGAALAALFA